MHLSVRAFLIRDCSASNEGTSLQNESPPSEAILHPLAATTVRTCTNVFFLRLRYSLACFKLVFASISSLSFPRIAFLHCSAFPRSPNASNQLRRKVFLLQPKHRRFLLRFSLVFQALEIHASKN